MNKIKLLTATAAGGLAALGTASAQEPARPYQDDPSGFYLGAGYTFIDIETDSDIEAFDDQGDSTNALTARLGYQVTPVFAVELDGTFGIDNGGFDLDDDEIDFSDLDDFGDVGDQIDEENLPQILGQGDIGLDYLFGIYGKVGFPVNEKFTVSGRLGYAFAEIDVSNEVEVTETIQNEDGTTTTRTTNIEESTGGSDDGFSFGAVARYNFNDSNAIRADYTRTNFGDANADAITISYQYTFGGPGLGY